MNVLPFDQQVTVISALTGGLLNPLSRTPNRR
jgi:hypothetical protein